MALRGKLSPEEARRLVLEPSDAELWNISHALDRDGEPFAGDVAARLVADMLEVGEPENWDRTTRDKEGSGELFLPFCSMPKDDGKTYRSWLPSDMGDDDEERVRAFANAGKNESVRARAFELLWARFHRFPDAEAALAARFASAPQCDAEEDWPRLVKNLGRLTTLLLSVNATKYVEPLIVALDEAAGKLVACSRPFAFPVLAEMVSNTLVSRKPGRDAFTVERAKRWADSLAAVAAKFHGDHLHGHDALMVLQGWHARWGNSEAARTVRREIVEHLSDAGKAADAMLAATLHQRALQAALDFGQADLAEAMRVELMGSIKRSLPDFKKVSGSFTLPPELLAEMDRLLATSTSTAAAVRQLAVFPGLLELDLARLRDGAHEHLKDAPFLAFAPTVHYHPDGKVTYQSKGLEGNVERHVAFLAGGHLALIEALLRYVLVRVLPRIQPATLLEALANWPHLPKHRAALLAVAAERFARSDWASSAFIVLLLYEAVLRDLLRACGYAALKAEQGGVQMDETLNSLLRSKAARSILGEGHCDFVEYVMCEPALGWNLRNEAAHGTVHPESLTPMRVFLAWLLLVRLTCFVAPPTTSGAGGDQSSEATEPQDQQTGTVEAPASPDAPVRGQPEST